MAEEGQAQVQQPDEGLDPCPDLAWTGLTPWMSVAEATKLLAKITDDIHELDNHPTDKERMQDIFNQAIDIFDKYGHPKGYLTFGYMMVRLSQGNIAYKYFMSALVCNPRCADSRRMMRFLKDESNKYFVQKAEMQKMLAEGDAAGAAKAEAALRASVFASGEPIPAIVYELLN